jgi:hypothetical protein
VLVCALAALPWLVLHHAVNYATGGTFKPANAVPEYFNWPGCPFSAQNMTGTWNHGSVVHFVTYAAALLAGKRGFLGHNLPIYLALPALAGLSWRRSRELPEILFCCFCSGGIWLAYALTSTNYSGECCSIRWFVPLLAPAYLALALLLREWRDYTWIFLTLTAWGVLEGAVMWYRGPWVAKAVPFYWLLQAGVAISLLAGWRWRRALASRALPQRDDLPVQVKAA